METRLSGFFVKNFMADFVGRKSIIVQIFEGSQRYYADIIFFKFQDPYIFPFS